MQDKLYRKVQLNKAYEDDYPATNKATRQRLDIYFQEEIDNGVKEYEEVRFYGYDSEAMDWYLYFLYGSQEDWTDEMFDAWWECQDNSILNNIKVVGKWKQ